MRNFKILCIGFLLVFPVLAVADASDVPDESTWYLHVDFERIRSDETGRGIYDWMSDEIFDEIKEESGADIGKELDQLTAFSLQDQGPVFLLEGDFSQTTEDRLMALIAAEGDLKPSKASGKQYYRLTDDDSDGSAFSSAGSDSIDIQIESLQSESWVSMALPNKILLTGNETQMKQLLASGGKIGATRNHGGAMVVLTAEKTLLQAGMNSKTLAADDDGDSGWNSNILRHTEQVAFLAAAKAGMLALEATLVTTEPDMANSLASVARGLISLLAFNDEFDAELVAVLQGAVVEAKGNNLSISLALDPELVAATLRD
jgi:hypothetical protein